jgi:ribonuclease BN (tRNA processing enzyme)
MTRPTLLPLGTGAGSTTVLHGEPSSSFAITCGEKARLLVDLGYGVVRQARQWLPEMPGHVYISHNHSDHSGDLPVIAIKKASEGSPLTIWSAPEVARRLQQHRLHEFREAGVTPEGLALWISTPEGVETALDRDLSLTTYRGQHSETCYGFVLRWNGEPVLGYSADSGWNSAFYSRLAAAPLLVLDARAEGSHDHASFEEVRAFAATVPGKRIFITHYGRAQDAPHDLAALQTGVPVAL